MLDDLDRTLEELLRRELSPNFVSPEALTPVTISFAAPDQDFTRNVSLPAIDLFLYDVRENLELRNSNWTVNRQSNGTALKQRPPVRVDCSYLITVWAKEQADVRTEHRLLGEVMRVLLRYPKIPAAVMQGSLREQEPLPRALTLRPTQLQSLGEFWQAMGGRPKPAMNYTVTIAIPVYTDEAEEIPLVMDRQI
jgi:Pvc16 N-terminal domain